jgi:hypothetical protein
MGHRNRKYKGNENETWAEDRNNRKRLCQCMGVKKQEVDTEINSEHQVFYLKSKT